MILVYRKPTFTGQYLNCQSCKWRKIGLIKTLYNIAQKISSPELLSNEIKVIKEILRKNGYPNTLIERVLNSEAKHSSSNVQSVEHIRVKPILFENYIKDITEKKNLFLC